MVDPLGHVAAKPTGTKEHPPDGWHDAVLCDWQDEGIVLNYGQWQPCVRLRFQIAARRSNGSRFTASRRLHRTLSRGAKLRTWAERLRGRVFSKAEAETGLQLEFLMDRPCRVQVQTFPRGDTFWTEVTDVAGWDYSVPRRPLLPEAFIRRSSHLAPWLNPRGSKADPHQSKSNNGAASSE